MMPTTEPTNAGQYRVGDVAVRLGVPVNTVRRWVDTYLTGEERTKGAVRLLSDDDLAVLQIVATLRADGKTPQQIRAAIDAHVAAAAPLPAVDAEHAIQAATAAPAGEELAIVVSAAMRAELEHYRAILEAEAGKVAAARWEGFSMGFTAAVLVILAALGALALLATWLGG